MVGVLGGQLLFTMFDRLLLRNKIILINLLISEIHVQVKYRMVNELDSCKV